MRTPGCLAAADNSGGPGRTNPTGLPLCHRDLRASPARRRRGTPRRLAPSVRVGSAGSLARVPALLSRVTYPARYGCLRDSGEELLLRRPDQRFPLPGTLPRGLGGRAQGTSGRADDHGCVRSLRRRGPLARPAPDGSAPRPSGPAPVARVRFMAFGVKWRTGRAGRPSSCGSSAGSPHWRKECRPTSTPGTSSATRRSTATGTRSAPSTRCISTTPPADPNGRPCGPASSAGTPSSP